MAIKYDFNQNRSIDKAIEIYSQRLADADLIYNKYSDGFVYRSCPVCDFENHIFFNKFNNTYDVVRCSRCAAYFVNPIPPNDGLSEYYNECECNKLLADLTRNRKFNIDDRVRKIIKLVENFNSNEISILEVGCSSGTFLSGLRASLQSEYPDKNFILSGIDLDSYAITSCVDNNLNLKCISAEQFVLEGHNKEQFDLVLHFELIEHLSDPLSFMRSLHKLMSPISYMVLTTPNYDGLENIVSSYNTRRLIAHAIFPPMHLNAYSVITVGILGFVTGFGVREISTPGRLDVDMCLKNEEFADNVSLRSLFLKIKELDADILGAFQQLISCSNGSSHMQVVFQKLI